MTELLADSASPHFVSVTRLRIRALRFLPSFYWETLRTIRQVTHADGFVAGSLLPDRRRTFWTMTLWRDQAAMRGYMTNGAHRRAMPHLLGWCDEASVVHWLQDDAMLPPWSVATTRMRTDGRASKVSHPGPHHADLSFAAPRLIGAVPIRAKR